MNPSSIFVTGTDTGIGKTVSSCALLHALRGSGLRAVGMKPVASGCEWLEARWRNEDALALQAASFPTPDYAALNPYALPAAVAPEFAARQAGIEIELAPMVEAYARLQALSDVVVIEGVGGWAAPLSAQWDQADVVRALGVPVVMVVGLRLGCINHARLTARAIQADGCRLIGWIANEVDPQMACLEENFDTLRQRLPVPCWGRLPWHDMPDAQAHAALLTPFA